MARRQIHLSPRGKAEDDVRASFELILQGFAPGAKLTVESQTTGLRREATSAADGGFIFPLLPPGTYNLTAESSAFRKYEQRGDLFAAGARPVRYGEALRFRDDELLRGVTDLALLGAEPPRQAGPGMVTVLESRPTHLAP